MTKLRDDLLLEALADRMFEEALQNPDIGEKEKANAMGQIFVAAAREFRVGYPSDLARAVLSQAKLGAHLVGEED